MSWATFWAILLEAHLVTLPAVYSGFLVQIGLSGIRWMFFRLFVLLSGNILSDIVDC
jgi:hypothetical protein